MTARCIPGDRVLVTARAGPASAHRGALGTVAAPAPAGGLQVQLDGVPGMRFLFPSEIVVVCRDCCLPLEDADEASWPYCPRCPSSGPAAYLVALFTGAADAIDNDGTLNDHGYSRGAVWAFREAAQMVRRNWNRPAAQTFEPAPAPRAWL